VTFKRIVILMCVNRVKCYILVQEICGCDSNSAFTTLPSAAGTPLFLFLAKKKCKESPMENFVGDLIPHRGKCCGFVQEFRYWGQNPRCSGFYSVTRNKRGIRLMISGTVLSHLTPTDLWRTFISFLKVSPRISRVKTYLRTRLFFSDCWPWLRC